MLQAFNIYLSTKHILHLSFSFLVQQVITQRHTFIFIRLNINLVLILLMINKTNNENIDENVCTLKSFNVLPLPSAAVARISLHILFLFVQALCKTINN